MSGPPPVRDGLGAGARQVSVRPPGAGCGPVAVRLAAPGHRAAVWSVLRRPADNYAASDWLYAPPRLASRVPTAEVTGSRGTPAT